VSDERLPDKIKTRIRDLSKKARLSAIREKVNIIRKTSREYGKKYVVEGPKTGDSGEPVISDGFRVCHSFTMVTPQRSPAPSPEVLVMERLVTYKSIS